jgi:hypothetical protein
MIAIVGINIKSEYIKAKSPNKLISFIMVSGDNKPSNNIIAKLINVKAQNSLLPALELKSAYLYLIMLYHSRMLKLL